MFFNTIKHPLHSKVSFDTPQHIAVATSGGADSLLLTILLNDALKNTPHTLTALTVDHGMRAESAKEAQKVHHYLTQNKISHVTLNTKGLFPGCMHQKARLARYEALALWCHTQGVHHLCLGHHKDDQIETFLMRLHKGSGAYGLGGMLNGTPLWGLWLWRPLLNMTKSDILCCARALKLPFCMDPSNENPRFSRARLRDVICKTKEIDFWQNEHAHYWARKESLWTQSEHAIAHHIRTWDQGMAILQPCPTSSMLSSNHLWPHMLRAILESITGRRTKPICLKSIDALTTSSKKQCTLGGCLITHTKKSLYIRREWPRIQDVTISGAAQVMLWDGRFLLELKNTQTGVLRALGHAPSYAHLPYHLKSYPALFQKDGTIRPFWDTETFQTCRWIQSRRFPQTQTILEPYGPSDDRCAMSPTTGPHQD